MMKQRQPQNTRLLSQKQADTAGDEGVNGHGHEHDLEHEHGHKHGIFHVHDEDHASDREQIIEALKGKGDRGSRVTLIGLGANVVLTASKGTAGWALNSASLIADAGHSLSDLLGDFVTLFCWQLSRRPRSNKYPYGYGKFETLGTTTVSLLLIGGALGIGFHSYHLLMDALAPAVQTMSPGIVQDMVTSATRASETMAAAFDGHSHSHSTLDPNAAWFALISVIAKEWLYRITRKVADDEKSSVLRANAIHHRSDAYSSAVALAAILGSWAIPSLPLDPIGGMLVSVVIFGQGLGLLRSAFRQLTDAGVSEGTRRSLVRTLDPLVGPSASPSTSLISVRDVRAVRSGASLFVDLVAHVKEDASMREAHEVQEAIRQKLVAHRKEIAEVRVKLLPASPQDST